MRERQRQTATKPTYYIRGIEITAQTGLGRFGGAGGPRQRLRAPSPCRPHGPRSCQMARYPRTTPAISTASLPVLSRRFRADPHEVGRIEGIGPDLWKLVSSLTRASTSRAAGELVDQGPAHRGQRRTRRPGPASAASRTLQKIVGAIVGAAYRVGHEHLRGSSPPRSPRFWRRRRRSRSRNARRTTRYGLRRPGSRPGLSWPLRRRCSPHRLIVGQPFSVVGILVARQTTVHRLPEKAHQSVLHVTTTPTLLQTLIRRLRQSQCIVQLAAGQQPSVRGDGSAAKLQQYMAVETERGAGVGAFTHWVPTGWVRYQELK